MLADNKNSMSLVRKNLSVTEAQVLKRDCIQPPKLVRRLQRLEATRTELKVKLKLLKHYF